MRGVANRRRSTRRLSRRGDRPPPIFRIRALRCAITHWHIDCRFSCVARRRRTSGVHAAQTFRWAHS